MGKSELPLQMTMAGRGNSFLLAVLGLLVALKGSHATQVQDEENTTPSCSVPYVAVGSHCLLVDHHIQGNRDQLDSVCRDLNGALVNIHDANLIVDLLLYMDGLGLEDQTYWVAATDRFQEGDWLWADGAPVKMGTPLWGDLFTEIQEPNGGEDENCAVLLMSDHYYMHDANCNETFSLLCEQDRVKSVKPSIQNLQRTSCPEPYQYIGGRCLFVNPIGTNSFSDMAVYCQNMSGHMAKIDDANLLGHVFDFLVSSVDRVDKYYWIGATDVAEEGVWLWHDGTPVTMGTPFWGDSASGIQAPDGGEGHDCAFLKPSDHFFFNDYTCEGDHTHDFGVICQYHTEF